MIEIQIREATIVASWPSHHAVVEMDTAPNLHLKFLYHGSANTNVHL